MSTFADRPTDSRRREYEARVAMGESPLRAAGALPLRERETPRRQRRLTREFLRKWCIGCTGLGWRA